MLIRRFLLKPQLIWNRKIHLNNFLNQQKFEAVNHYLKYEKHRPTSCFQKGLLAVSSAVVSLSNPLRSDMVATLGETLIPENSLRNIQLQMLRDKSGSQILRDKPFINTNTINVEELLKYPKNTFGYNYALFMKNNNISSDTRNDVHYIDNTELAFIMSRYRQIHDFVHVLLGFPISIAGEVVVKWFEMIHFGLPMNYLAALFGSLASLENRNEIAKFIPWAIYTGQNSKQLMNVYFEEELQTDFQELKRNLNIYDPPYKRDILT